MTGQRALHVGFKQCLVTVQKVRARLMSGFRHPVHRMGRQHVIVIQQAEILALRQSRRGIGVGRNALVFHPHVLHTRLGFQILAHGRMLRVRRIGHAQFPVLAGLRLHALHHLF